MPHRVVAVPASIRWMLPTLEPGTLRSQLISPYLLPSTYTQMNVGVLELLGLRFTSQFG